MSKLLFFEDLNVGDRWTSPAKQITHDDVARFAELTLDFNPIHLDEAFASSSPFGRPIAHGLLGLSLVAGLASESPPLETVALLAVRNWQFLRPIYYGDRVHVETEVLQLEASGRKRGRVMWERTLINQSGYSVQQGQFETLITRRQTTPQARPSEAASGSISLAPKRVADAHR